MAKKDKIKSTDKIAMVAQLILSVVLFVSVLISIYAAWFSKVEISPDRLRVIDTMVGVLGASFTMVISFWFARQRNAVEDTREDPEEDDNEG